MGLLRLTDETWMQYGSSGFEKYVVQHVINRRQASGHWCGIGASALYDIGMTTNLALA